MSAGGERKCASVMPGAAAAAAAAAAVCVSPKAYFRLEGVRHNASDEEAKAKCGEEKRSGERFYHGIGQGLSFFFSGRLEETHLVARR